MEHRPKENKYRYSISSRINAARAPKQTIGLATTDHKDVLSWLQAGALAAQHRVGSGRAPVARTACTSRRPLPGHDGGAVTQFVDGAASQRFVNAKK